MRPVLAVLAAAAWAAPARASPPPEPPLFDLAERVESGKVVAYPEAPVVDVDVNSSVIIHLRPEAMTSPASGLATGERGRRMDELAALQRTLNAAEEEALRQANVADQARRRDVALAGEALAAFQKGYADLLRAFQQARRYVEAAEPGTDAYERLISATPGDILTPIRAYLAREHARLQDGFRADVDASSTKSLSLTAWIGSPPRQLHLPGYDDLPPGVAQVVDKTRFVFDQRFQEEYRLAQKLAKTAGDWNSLGKKAEEALRSQLTSLAGSLEGLEEHARRVQKALSGLPKLSEDAKRIAAEIKEIASSLRLAVDRALRPPPGADPADLLIGVVGALQSNLDKVAKIVQDVRDLAKEVATKGTPTAKALVGELASRVAEIGGAATRADVAAQPQLAEVRVRLADARDTELSLVQADRREGDVVTIRARLREGDATVPGGETVRHLRVRARGVVADVGAAVLFVRPIAPDPGALMPAAGAYAVLRYKGSRSAGEANSTAWNILAPGLGIVAVAIPRRQDGGTDIAWLATVHLVGDILQAAIGATTDLKPVWGVGIGLHRIAGIGTYFQ